MIKSLCFLAFVCTFGLLAACGNSGSPGPTAEPTNGSQANHPGDITRAIAAAKAGDGALLGSLLTTTSGPCVVDPRPGILYSPACPPGAAAGSAVPALVFGGCPDEFSYIDPSLTFRVTEFDPAMFLNHLIGVVDLGEEPLRYAALFGYEKVMWLGFDSQGKLIGAGGGGDCPAYGLRPRLTGNQWLTGPDWGE